MRNDDGDDYDNDDNRNYCILISVVIFITIMIMTVATVSKYGKLSPNFLFIVMMMTLVMTLGKLLLG